MVIPTTRFPSAVRPVPTTQSRLLAWSDWVTASSLAITQTDLSPVVSIGEGADPHLPNEACRDLSAASASAAGTSSEALSW